MVTTLTPNTPPDDPEFNPGEVSTTPRLAPPDDGNFDHPGLQGIPGIVDHYDLEAIGQQLFDDAGVEWPAHVSRPVHDINDEPLPSDEGDGQGSHDEGGAPPSPPPTINVGGRTISADEVNAAIHLYELLKTNPGLVSQQPTPQPPAEPPPPEPESIKITLPDDFTDSDPNSKFLVSELEKVNQQLHQLQQVQVQSIREAQLAKIKFERDEAFSNFRKAHPTFTDTEIDEVARQTASMGIVGNMAAGSDNPAQAIFQALEIGMYQVNSTRDKVIASLGQTPTPTPPNSDDRRRRKLGALSGTSGSTPRTDANPRLDNDHSMKLEIAKAVEPYFANNNN